MKITLPEVSLPDDEISTPEGRLVVPGQVFPGRSLEIDPAEISGLLEAARSAAGLAYAPFSRFHVGAALKMADDPEGRVFTGSNVENSSYGATNCAERTAIFSASAMGFRKIRILALTTMDSRDAPLSGRSPCGVCRQVIREFADAGTLLAIDTAEEGKLCDLVDVERVLPWGFCFEGNGEMANDNRPSPIPSKGSSPG